MKGLTKKKTYMYHIDTDSSVLIASGKVGCRWAKRGKMGFERDAAWVMDTRCSEHMMFLLSGTLKTYMVLWANVTPINSIKRQVKK